MFHSNNVLSSNSYFSIIAHFSSSHEMFGNQNFICLSMLPCNIAGLVNFAIWSSITKWFSIWILWTYQGYGQFCILCQNIQRRQNSQLVYKWLGKERNIFSAIHNKTVMSYHLSGIYIFKDFSVFLEISCRDRK